MSLTANSKSKANPPCWPDSVEKTFIELTVSETEARFCLNKKGFERIGVNLWERTGRSYSYSQLKKKFHQLRIRYKGYCKLLNIHAPTDAVRKVSYEEAIENLNLRGKRFPMLNELDFIFEEYDWTHPKLANNKDADGGVDVEYESTAAASDKTSNLEDRCIVGVACEKKLMDLTDAKNNVEGNSVDCAGFSITNCVKILECIEGVDSDTYLKAIKLFKDANWREVFMAMSGQRRLDWLSSLK